MIIICIFIGYLNDKVSTLQEIVTGDLVLALPPDNCPEDCFYDYIRSHDYWNGQYPVVDGRITPDQCITLDQYFEAVEHCNSDTYNKKSL